ncbi:hypothetical protein [Mycobacterium riyadhense]|uniref:hypothetical protein n=1 Tax=Mycobacterium riyadhense TaxID=486698 RepID=UPI00195B18D1|nr:hypothetical protein [Mycobacterium riyadhense]
MSDRLRKAQLSAARRASIERHGVVPASVPVWLSREAWIDAVRAWVASTAFRAVCAALGTRGVISAAALVAVAVALAEFADHATGRNVAVTNRVLAARAGCSERTVTTARTVLAAAGFGVEAQRGHGSASTHTAGNRPSIWHLVSRHQPTSESQRGGDEAVGDAADHGRRHRVAVDTCDLPPSGGSTSLSPVENYSPSARDRAPAQDHPSTQARARRRWRATPRPLPMQRLAGQLAARAHGLDRGHVGALCDALTTAGIDPHQWTAQQLSDALNADMRATGWSWPDRIERPGAFLAARLRRMLARRAIEPQKGRGTAAASPEQTVSTGVQSQPGSVPTPRVLTGVQQRITEAKAYAQQQLAEARQRRADRTAIAPGHRAPIPGHRAPIRTAVVPATGACSCCGAPDAPRRSYLPAHRAHVCARCWDTSDQLAGA